MKRCAWRSRGGGENVRRLSAPRRDQSAARFDCKVPEDQPIIETLPTISQFSTKAAVRITKK